MNSRAEVLLYLTKMGGLNAEVFIGLKVSDKPRDKGNGFKRIYSLIKN